MRKLLKKVGFNKHANAIMVGNSGFRVVSLYENDLGVGVKSFGSVSYGQKTVENGQVVNPRQFVASAKSVRDSFGITSAKIGISYEAAFLFHTQVPLVPDGSPEDAIHDHIVSYLKLHNKDLENETSIEYEILDTTARGYDVYVAVILEKVLNEYRVLFKKAGIKADSIGVAFDKLSRRSHGNSGSSHMYLDFGKNHSRIMLSDSGRIALASVLPFGGESLIQEIQKFLKIDKADAKKIYDKYGLLKTHREPKLLSNMLVTMDQLLDRMDKKYVAWHGREYKNNNIHIPVTSIHIMGEHAGLVGLLERINERMKLPTEHFDVWNGVQLASEVPEIPYNEALYYAPAISLALDGLE